MKETADLIAQEAPSAKVYVYSADLNDRASLEKAIVSFAGELPSNKIDILLANAGVGNDIVPLSGLPLESFHRDLALNTISSLSLLQLISPHLATNPTIIHTSTGAAHVNMPGNSCYSISKLAGAMIFQQWAMENPNHFVISFHPGYIETDMSKKSAEQGMDLGAFDDSKSHLVVFLRILRRYCHVSKADLIFP